MNIQKDPTRALVFVATTLVAWFFIYPLFKHLYGDSIFVAGLTGGSCAVIGLAAVSVVALLKRP
jgi:hypothetical protein